MGHHGLLSILICFFIEMKHEINAIRIHSPCQAERPTPEEICAQYPVPAHLVELKRERDSAIRKVFTGESDKFVLIIGPCSADNEDAVCDYTSRLAGLQEKVADRLILIPRIYTNKPRTTGDGYKGIFHQPDPWRISSTVLP